MPFEGSQVSLRTVFTVSVGVLVVVAVVYAITQMTLAITLTLLATMIAIALDHAVSRLERLGFRRWLAILVVGVLVGGGGVLLGILLIAPAASQAQVLARDLPQLVDKVRGTEAFQSLDRSLGLSGAIDRIGQEAPALIFRGLNALVGLVGAVIATILLAVFMLIFGAPLVERVLGEIEPGRRQQLRRVVDAFYRSVGAYTVGITIIAWCNAVATATFLAIVRMPFFLPLALAAGASSMVPYVGTIVSGITISLLALATGGLWQAVACAVFFLAYGQIEGNVLSPLIFRRTVHVNPLVVTLSILFFGEMAGIFGAFVAIPIVATLQIILAEVLRARRERPEAAPVD